MNKNKRHHVCKQIVVFLAAIILLWHGQLLAQVYKYTDENGIVNYTNIKPAGSRYTLKVIGCYGTCKRAINWHTVALDEHSHADRIATLSKEYGIDAAVLRALIHAESGFRIDATSPVGAQGLMQLMPETARMLDVSDPYDAAQNLAGGTRYLAGLLEEFDQDLQLALAAYNAGPTAVRQHGGVPPYAETTEYLRRINILRSRYAAADASMGASSSQ
jgi:soluble lytic murein transglycosylase-like protein